MGVVYIGVWFRRHRQCYECGLKDLVAFRVGT